jgi:hypothetical protein
MMPVRQVSRADPVGPVAATPEAGYGRRITRAVAVTERATSERDHTLLDPLERRDDDLRLFDGDES